jgi:hypothetical protein
MAFDCAALLPGHNRPFAQGARAATETEHSTMSFVKQSLAISQSSGSIEIVGDACRHVSHVIVAELRCNREVIDLDLSWRRNLYYGDLEL